MAYKQKAEDLKEISRSMKDKSNYGPGPGDEDSKDSKTETTATDIVEATDPTEGMDRMEELYYLKSIGQLPSIKVGDREYLYDYEKGGYSHNPIGSEGAIVQHEGVNKRIK